MKLNKHFINEARLWSEKGYTIPGYDRDAVIKRTIDDPEWIHFGAGNIFRSFPALLAEEMLEKKKLETGILVVEGFDYEIIDRIYEPYDDLSILFTLGADMKCEKRIIGSVCKSLKMGKAFNDDNEVLRKIFRSDSLKMVSFTITEKGYKFRDPLGKVFEAVEQDLNAGPERAATYMGMVAALLYERYLSGSKPIAMLSMDNFSHNGEKLESAITEFAETWSERGLADKGFEKYVKDRKLVSFPWSMIDKITPRPDKAIKKILDVDGVEGNEIIITEKQTYIAPFVNAEKSQYLVIEDDFPNGRPPLETAGVYFTDRITVDKTERMKVCTCLNPLHTALAVFGCLLGFKKISDEMKDPLLKKLVYDLGYKEGLPVVTDPVIISPDSFLREVLEERIPNPFLPDTPQRIATDTSQKLPIRYGETIRAYMEDPDRDAGELKLVPLVIAGWIRYLMGIDDEGTEFTLSPDPLAEKLGNITAGLCFGLDDRERVERIIGPLLANKEIFGADLKKAGLYDKVIDMYMEMAKGRGCVKKTMEKYVNER